MTSGLPVQNIRRTRAKHLQKVGPLSIAKLIVGLFSTNDRRRKPPNSFKTQHIRLVTIRVSHYCEKGRWALDILEADDASPFYYTEDAHPPALSSFAAVEASKDKGSITPLVLLDEPINGQHYIAESDAILRTFCPFLYPEEIRQDVMNMEDDLGQRLGPTIRAYCYHHLLQPTYQSVLSQICGQDTSKVECWLFEKMMDKGIEKGMRKVMGITEESAATSETEIRKVFAEISDKLDHNGGAYILDTKRSQHRFTAADLSFAALASPLLRPVQLQSLQCEDDELPPPVLAFADELKATSAGKHALHMYKEHRVLEKGASVVSLKSVNRDRVPWPEFAAVATGLAAVAAIIGQHQWKT